jgi:hypothetical protein
MGGKVLDNPESTSIVVATRKNISNINAISAMEAVGISGIFLAIVFLFHFLLPDAGKVLFKKISDLGIKN